jgi:hypothetical protein
MMPGVKPIGTMEILTDVPDDDDGSLGCKKAINYNATVKGGDHSNYRFGCSLFLPDLPMNY